jgi:hypothetical protein
MAGPPLVKGELGGFPFIAFANHFFLLFPLPQPGEMVRLRGGSLGSEYNY